MNYSFDSLQYVLELLKKNGELGITKMSQISWKSRVILHKYVKELLELWKIEKIWVFPKVKYRIVWEKNKELFSKVEKNNNEVTFWYREKKILDEIFFKFSADGKILSWYNGLYEWCNERRFQFQDKVKSYIDIYYHIENMRDDCWLLPAGWAFWKDFESVYLNNVFYADQYKRMDFWRGKLAEITFYGKLTQNKKLIGQSIDEIIDKLECKIRAEKYHAIAITPWSIERNNQLLKLLKQRLEYLWLPFINIVKYYPNGIAIPQKSLKTREQRIQNAKNTIFINDKNIHKYKKVFLIDDFVWSGSTLNQTAHKLKSEWVKIVDGFAFVGNLNLSYEVINEI